TSFDAALIAQKSVGICSPPIIKTGQWVITPADRTHIVVDNDITDDFDAYMMGDVDGSWDPLGASRPALARVSNSPDAVQVGLPAVTADAGTRVSVPLRMDNMMGRGVTSYQFDIEYDPTVIEPAELAADLVGAVPAELAIVSNAPIPGVLKVTVYGAFPATGDGVYANLHFNVRGAMGSSSPLAIRGFMLNDDRWEVNTTDGVIMVGRVNAERPSIKGRILTTDGSGVLNAIVTLTSTTGKIQSMRSGEGGAFEFTRVVAGETYTLTIQSKRFRYQPRTVSMSGNAVELDVIAEQ
ncbi:MAG: cohesin domain-containing protein, partial [Pyrinomonadaceae bacterium]